MAGLREFIANQRDSLLPVTREIIQGGRRFDAVSVFDALHELRNLQQVSSHEWAKMDVMLLPTAGTIYSITDVEADPIHRNSNLGYYTTFVNLLDLCAVAVPAGFRQDGLPLGVTLMAPPGNETALLELGNRLHRSAEIGIGAARHAFPSDSMRSTKAPGFVRLAVVGAHLTGQPLNPQLTQLNARLVRACRTAPIYRLFSLAGTKPPKPGLVRVADSSGNSIEVEVWEMTPEAFGRFIAATPPPMGFCTLRLEDGEEVKGFTCESCATLGSRDITEFGGWRKYLAAQ
jgi:allophanate hydrolase